MDIREQNARTLFLHRLIDSDNPNDKNILKLEVDPNMKYVETEVYHCNNLGQEISEKEFNLLRKNEKMFKFFRVYRNECGELIKVLS